VFGIFPRSRQAVHYVSMVWAKSCVKQALDDKHEDDSARALRMAMARDGQRFIRPPKRFEP
jgi:hypothetical protein